MKKVYLFICLLLVGSVVQAATNTWNIAGSGNWNTPSNWSLGTVPDATDDVVFANTSNITVTLDFATSTTVRSITIGNTANVTFSGGTPARTINLGAVTSCLVVPSGRALTLTGTASGSNGVVISIPTGGSCTINGTFNLATFGNAITTQVNQLLAVDVASVSVASGGVINYNANNSGVTPFGSVGANTGVIVFQSGSTFTAYSSGNAFGNTSGAGIPTFQQGSTFNLFGGTVMGAAGNFANGRTYGRFVMGNGGTGGAQANATTTTTTFLDSLVISSGTLTLSGDASVTASPTFSIKNIRVSTATTGAVALTLRTNTGATAPNTTYEIGGTVQVIAAATSTTGTATLTLGPNAVGGATSFSNTNITFTGANSSLQSIRQSGGSGYPDVRIGSPSGGTGGMVTNITVANGASLALGDSLTLRGGDAPSNSYTTFTIKPTGKLTLTDAAVLKTNNNGYAKIESNATSTGTISTVAGKLENGFVVQRYIPANAAWRTLGLPFNSVTYDGRDQSLLGGNTVSLNYFASRTPTWAYHYNEAADDGKYGTTGGVNAGWTAITTSTTGLDMRNGLLLYGSRNQSAYTLSDTGFINYGDQTIALSKTVNGWNLIANPYPSNISFTSIVNNGSNAGILTSNTVYRVNPLGNGAYSWASYVSGSGTGSNGGSDVIENGAAFFVQAANASTNITIKETDKTTNAVGSTTGGVTLMGANDNYNSIRVSLKGANTFSDEVVFVWGRFSKATEGFDNDLDAYDLGASGTHDLSIVDKEGTRYAIFNGADLPKDAETRTYKLATKNLRLGTYDFEVSMPKALDRNNEAYLVDNYLGTAVLVKEGLSHSFQVTADAASKAEGRFQLEVRKKLTSVIDEVATSKTYLLSNPTRNNQFAIHFGSDAQVANWQVVDLSGRVISTGMFKNVYQGDTRVGELKALQSGTYLVRLFNDNEPTVVMKLVKL